jgi:diaminopimelate decarboxylase
LLVIDEQHLRAAIRRFCKAFAHPRWRCHIIYAAKALALSAIAQIVGEEELGFDACSEGELRTAFLGNVAPSSCILHGCAKTERELQIAVRSRVRFIIVDNQEEVLALGKIAEREGFRAPILLRVNVGIAAPTRAEVQTSAPASKFGFPIQDGQARIAAMAVARNPWLELRGVHCHIGSQITDLQVYAEVIRRLGALVLPLEHEQALTLEVVNIGGGLGLPQTDTDSSGPTPEAWAKIAFDALDETFAGEEARRILMIEPGRAIVARAGTTLYSVCVRKMLANGDRAIVVDGGMSDNPRPALYGAAYPVSVASRENQPPDGIYTVFGRHCEADLLFPNLPLPNPQVGDVLVVKDTGAYTYSMASNYNLFPKPAVILRNRKSARVIAKRESLDHLLELDVQKPPRENSRK